MAITTRAQVMTNLAKGLGWMMPTVPNANASNTAAAAASGFLSCQIFGNNIGTTSPTTFVGFPQAPSPPSNMLMTLQVGCTGSKGGWLANFYKLGTLNLAATGNQFTHDAATFPVLRTQFGAASQPVSLIPVLEITTSTATTAPAFILETVTPTAGYVNQDGTSVTGTVTFTCPAAATVAGGAYILMLNQGDSAVQDITQINVTVAGSAGAATLWGVEPLMPIIGASTVVTSITDGMFGGLCMMDTNPAAATSGSATSFLGLFVCGSTNNAISTATLYQAVLNS